MANVSQEQNALREMIAAFRVSELQLLLGKTFLHFELCTWIFRKKYLCLVLLQLAKNFCAGPNFLSQPKNLAAFSSSSKTCVLAQKPVLLNANHLFVWHKMFVTATICKYIFGLTQKIWTGTKHFGTCKRTRHSTYFPSIYTVPLIFWMHLDWQ